MLREHPQGLTLVELMIAVAISSTVVAGAYNLFVVERRSYSLQDDLAQMYQTMRSCEQIMVREIRMAGYALKEVAIVSDVPGTVFTDGEKEDAEEATAGAFTFTSDVDGDGVMETVRYFLRDSELVRQLWRWDNANHCWRSGGGARSMATPPNFGPPPSGGIICCSPSISTVTAAAPVWAPAIRSPPWSTAGIACAWIGVGVV